MASSSVSASRVAEMVMRLRICGFPSSPAETTGQGAATPGQCLGGDVLALLAWARLSLFSRLYVIDLPAS
jgi:hypothetical protein